MNFNFNTDRTTLIIAPVDMWAGYERLSLIAAGLFGIYVDAGKGVSLASEKSRACARCFANIWTPKISHTWTAG